MEKAERGPGGTRLRRCVATGQSHEEDGLLRFVAGPDGLILPDPGARAPGRGVWTLATRAAVELAARKGGFARGLKRAVSVPDGLADLAEGALERRVLDFLGLARRSGGIHIGSDQVASALRSGPVAWRIEASDGAADGRRKLDGLSRAWGAIPVAGCLSGTQMGMALGRDHVIHVALPLGPFAGRWAREIGRLAGFRPLVPVSWGPAEP